MKNRKLKKFWQSVGLLLLDVVLFIAAALFSFLSTNEQGGIPTDFLIWSFANVIALTTTFGFLGLYTMMLSHASLMTGFKIIFGAGLVGALNLVFVILSKASVVGYWTVFVFFTCVVFFSACVRFSYRLVLFIRHRLNGGRNEIRSLIVGGGDAGAMIIREMQQSERIFHKPVCIVDDDPYKLGLRVGGVKVVGAIEDIPDVVKEYRIQEIFVCMPSVSKARVSGIFELCRATGIAVKIMPGMYQFTTGQISIEKMREVEITDLLGREQVRVNLDEIMGYIEGKKVLVTGGGGSIGSELCRQIATHNPEQLIIFDVYENNAYEIEQELKRKHPDLNLLTLIGSIRDKGKIEDLFKTYHPEIVFHAAAHKHVPLMETSPNEAVKNNVYGTLNVARAADKYGVQTFVQISTDKAVNPTNIMGATKRICEMIIQTIGRRSKNTNFVAVRFGNVLGSNGSVIPLFKKQIAEGGPVTVTSKDIIRYFMTIPEAVSLVLQAGAYAKNGQIFVLDMGEPVRIYDLAYNLIKLSGFEPEVDIKIECTGLRPGEKLYEERLMAEEGLQKTANGLISVAKPIELDEDRLWTTLDRLYDEAYSETDGMKELVKELVPTYKIDKR